MTHPDPARVKELVAIHVAKKNLALAEDSYRALVARFSGGRTESSAGLTGPERRALIDEFRRLGFAPVQRGAARVAQAGPPAGRPAQRYRRKDERPQAAKLRALWLSLWQLAEVSDPGEGALAMFVKRHCDVDALQFASGADLNRAIEHLKQWCRRVGYDVLPFESPFAAPLQASFKPGLIEAQWRRLAALGAFRTGDFARLDTFLRGYGVAAPQFLSNAQADAVIDRLGQWARQVRATEETP